jgi:ABC-type transport system involved in multi-copper enzyme maturation permease subunit
VSWMLTLPESLARFFARVLGLEGWPAIVVANDVTELFFVVYWLGVFDLLTFDVVPREEGYLEVLMSKPLTRCAYMAAKLLPILLVTTAIGMITATVHGLALPAAGLTYDPSAYAGAAAVIIGWTVCLIGLVNLLILWSAIFRLTEDSFIGMISSGFK